jgi:hypothetical protein
MSDEKTTEPVPGDISDKRGVVSQRLRLERHAEELRANLRRRKAKARVAPPHDK